MKPYFSKALITALLSSSVNVLADDVYWASGVDKQKGWTADFQYPNQCWGAVAGNMLGWWKRELKTPVLFNPNTPNDNKEISKWLNKKYPNIQGGLYPFRGMEYFFEDFAPTVKLYETHNTKTSYEAQRGPTKISGGPFWTERYDSNAALVTKSLVENFKTGNVVAALTSWTHTVTLWGIEVDEKTGKIKKGYISDSVADQAGNLKMVEVTGDYVLDNKGNEIFRFLYSYYVPNGNKYVTDVYDIYSITYVSIDETRNNGTYKDTTNREDCKLSLAPGADASYCGISNSTTTTTATENNSSTNTETVAENTNEASTVTTEPAPEETDVDAQSSNTETSETETVSEVPPTEEAVAETSEQPTAVPTPEVAEPAPEPTPSLASTETATVSEVKPTEPETAEHRAVKSLKAAIANYQELSFVTSRVGDVTRYLIQREGINIALIDPNSKQILVNNTGLVNYDLTQDQNGNIHITKSPNQAAIKEANEVTSLHTDLNHVEMNNLNKRMGELRGIDANAGVWARVLGGKGSSDSYKHKFTHIQTGFDKQSHLSNAELFTGVTVTHTSTDIEGKIGSTNGDVKSIGAGVYATALFDNGFYLDTIAKYVKNNHKFDYAFKEMKLDFKSQQYHTHSFYLGGEVGYRFNLGSGYVEPQAEVIYVKNSQANLADNGHKLTIKASNGLVGRLGVNAGKTFEIGQSKATAWAGIGYQWDIAKRNEILVDGISASNSKKDARMLMDLGLNIRANDKLSIGLSLEGSVFGKYNTDLSVNSNIRYSF
ncbi:IdeS/Mac family cysteine endopeptidase [Glaesserella parasuis]|uniref:IdeS/Mac family cysteine endopeptidase n=1 Tax=Glaesserella parasuis TaxID=738 RepID=UPI0003AC21E5|nr:autotransporter outer membrane beta-barrel domain-containing protein [Glaesserella parasuis]EQA08486.1 hemoglobin-binding protease hbp autotransporter [Glaesserella parasuis 84-15995]MCT8525931.1 IdeS/Mac family cysteine endopeptidase [Glaesserella parasuis]MCT8528031.1 IdeS/Mac family cysteine endopeptidase [Glaesserella parasuis]MCT8530111.1 IdeS/Mac family cysteine endopeptidase [Glaesserella parasuis]MCT8531803.1 IdeS/Mac family cysteine endopeptidase [Glaesserella parasuis]